VSAAPTLSHQNIRWESIYIFWECFFYISLYLWEYFSENIFKGVSVAPTLSHYNIRWENIFTFLRIFFLIFLRIFIQRCQWHRHYRRARSQVGAPILFNKRSNTKYIYSDIVHHVYFTFYILFLYILLHNFVHHISIQTYVPCHSIKKYHKHHFPGTSILTWAIRIN